MPPAQNIKALTQAVHVIPLVTVAIYRSERQALIENLDTSGLK
jgi:hypothetical protein